MTVFKVPMNLYLEARDEELARALADVYAFWATYHLRKMNSRWIEDLVTLLEADGKASIPQEIPTSSYSKELLTKAFGEEKAIRLLNLVNSGD